jgi:ketosteroid isomerase-like protein
VSTSANLDLLRSLFTAWQRGDFSSTEWVHPDIEFVMADGPSPGRWVGPAGLAEGWGDWLRAWEGYRVAAEGYRELDHERVLVLVNRSGRGKTSGLDLGEMRNRGAAVFQVREGKVAKFVYYCDSARALADLGLAPEDDAR